MSSRKKVIEPMAHCDPHLVILPTIKAQIDPAKPDHVVLTGKFLSGMQAYVDYWPGPVTLLIEWTESKDTNMDHQSVCISDLPYKLKFVDFEQSNLSDQLAVADVVLASVYWRQNHISKLCESVNVPCVYVSEYAFETRCQMEKARAKNLLVFLRRVLWHWLQERQHRRALMLATGLQANGTPTYNDYLGLAKHSLLYFDSRVSKKQMASHRDIKQRYKDIDSGRPLRLAFSGRLLPIKGVDHLPVIAQYLDRMQVPFTLDICGDGELFDSMIKQIDVKNLGDQVRMLGVLDFQKQLIPLMKQDIDLFVCPHRQGDPSCTYLETMSCGVPIIGYDNAAFTGICEYSDAGWLVPMDRPKQVAQQIAQLYKHPQQIVEHAVESLNFAKNHSFEDTFSRRVDHLIQLARRPWEVTQLSHESQPCITENPVQKETIQ